MFLIVCFVYLLVIVGLAIGIWRYFKAYWAKISGVFLLLLTSLMFFLQRAVVDICPLWVSKTMYFVGTIWLVVVLYGVLICTVLFLARLLARFKGNTSFNPLSPILVASLVLLTLGVGYKVATSPQIVRYGINSNYMTGNDTLRFALVSDLHMGYNVNADDIQKLVDIVNAENVDFCIIAGDLVDGDLHPVLTDDIGAPLRSLSCPAFAVMGNHEYMDNAETASDYIKSLGLTLLKDSVATWRNIAIVGRNDKITEHFLQRERTPLSQLVPKDTFTIVVDHQPVAIKESAEAGAALYLSGHTHAGQVWPMRLFTKSLYDNDYGMYGFENTVSIVTSGFGTWGPRVRLGSISEVVIVTVTR